MARPGRKPVAYNRSPIEEQIDRAMEIGRELDSMELEDESIKNPFEGMEDEELPSAARPTGPFPSDREKLLREPRRTVVTLTVAPVSLEIMDKLKFRTGLSRGRLFDWLLEKGWEILNKKREEDELSDVKIRRRSRSFQRRREIVKNVERAARMKVRGEE